MSTFAHSLRRRGRPSRGSLLIVAMILCSVIGISIVSYLGLGRTAMGISNRALYNNAAMNLAENGLEQAVYAINRSVSDPSYNWSSNYWIIVGSDARQKWTDTGLGQGAEGVVRAYVYDYAGTSQRRIISRSVVTLGGGSAAPIEKWIDVRMRKTSRFANGLVAKDTIAFSGTNASVDSWVSGWPTTATPYSTGVRKAGGTIGSISVVSSVFVNNADIWGYAATGGTLPSVGPNGLVGPFGTGAGTMDMSHVSTDFSASFDPVTAPVATYTDYGGAITTNESLPRGGIDTPAADGFFYISADSVNLNNKTLTITGKVILRLTNALTAIDIVGGGAGLNLDTGAELQVYGPGDIKIAGQGLLNGGTTTAAANQPAKCQFYGTKTSGTQDIQIVGNGVLSAVVYAPQGSVKINGNGDVCGSVVAKDITCTGNAAFHYDESLASFGGNNPYRVSLWKELTMEFDRTAVSGVVSW